ncbi:MBL fold metallo-hydrolase [Pseudoduganella ginsengisoli]|uniref:MBL fold metallo-hydrolase n=1 Tax=Pseudoduganella ginsengisoli TaxID=1462440 RepID=A0A6L6Q8R9_9BURK|nr:MBL fold metallo-hydrolase [Pseudoduganella ginsengisoli]MTW05849.1 MBL fold metallo-hydrolase [Pseudoduganella ginsengisoli]
MSKIIEIPILPFGMVHCHALIGEKGVVLVDTGLPGSSMKIARALHKHGRRLSDVRLIVITHAHVDHAGSAAELRALTGAPIMAHGADLDYYERRKPMTFCETGWFGRFFYRLGLINEPYAPFTPDILLTDSVPVDLAPYGVDGVARHTPGHTAGSVSIQLASGDAMVGDLLASGVLLGGVMRTGRAIRPPFEDDPAAVSEELIRLINAGMRTFHMGHGGPLPVDEVRLHAIRLQSMRAGRKFGKQLNDCGCTRGQGLNIQQSSGTLPP